MSPDDLWVLGLRANGVSYGDVRDEHPWMLRSWEQEIADLGHLPARIEAFERAARGLTMPADPLDDESFAETVERLGTQEGDANLLCGPLGRVGDREVLSEREWDALGGFFPEAERQRMLSHTYVLNLSP